MCLSLSWKGDQLFYTLVHDTNVKIAQSISSEYSISMAFSVIPLPPHESLGMRLRSTMCLSTTVFDHLQNTVNGILQQSQMGYTWDQSHSELRGIP